MGRGLAVLFSTQFLSAVALSPVACVIRCFHAQDGRWAMPESRCCTRACLGTGKDSEAMASDGIESGLGPVMVLESEGKWRGSSRASSVGAMNVVSVWYLGCFVWQR